MKFNLEDYLRNFESLPWLPDGLAFLTKVGSQAYGMATPESDLDVKGFAVAPLDYYLGFMKKFEQAETKNPGDFSAYNINKFMHLAADCNPSVLEMLFTDESDWLVHNWVADELIKHRDHFVSKKCKFTYSGYAISQVKRIVTHRRWLLNPPKAPPTREEYGLLDRTLIPKDQRGAAETAIKNKIAAWKVEWPDTLDDATKIDLEAKYTKTLTEMSLVEKEWELAGKSLGYDSNFMELIVNEKRYQTAKHEWAQYQTWLQDRNPKRAELEKKYGFDTKHGAHVVRLMRQCKEILTTGKVVVKRPDADELLAIRGGAWSYDQMLEWATAQDAEMDKLYAESKLPKSPDREFLDKLCVRLITEFNFNQ